MQGPPPVMAVTVLGLAGEALTQVLDMTERRCREQNVRAVIVTDSLDFEPFRKRRLVVEHVAAAETMRGLAPDLAWCLYERRLYALLRTRWEPAVVVHFGRPPDEACLKALGDGG